MNRLSVVVVSLLTVAGLAGCTSPGRVPDLDPEQAKAEIVVLPEPVQALVAGDWEDLEKAAEACSVAGGTGARYGMLRIGPSVEEGAQQAFLDAVVAQWTKGFRADELEAPADRRSRRHGAALSGVGIR